MCHEWRFGSIIFLILEKALERGVFLRENIEKQVHQFMPVIVSKMRYFLFYTTIGKWLGIVVGGGLLFAAYLFVSRAVVYNADNASILLQSQAMRQGNLLLRGWFMPTDDFLTGEIPLYALGQLLGFSMPALLQIVPALLYTLLVLIGSYLVVVVLEEKQRAWGVLLLLGIVAFPALDMVQGMLIGPLHFGTILYALCALIAYRRVAQVERGRWLAYATLLLLTLLMVLGDPFALVLFVAPLFLTETIEALAQRRVAVRAFVTMGGVLVMTILAFMLRSLLNNGGTHILITAGFSFTSLEGMLKNLRLAVGFLATIFHANVLDSGPFSLATLPSLLNALVLLALLFASIRWCLCSLRRSTMVNERLVNILNWSLLGVLAAFILSTLGITIRYLYPMLFLGGIIGFVLIIPLIKKRVLVFATLLVLIVNGSLFATLLWQAPSAGVPEAQLITLLREHHLTRGLATYWVAPIVTVQSKEQIVLRQVQVGDDRYLRPYVFLADEQWFHASNLRDVNFIVYRNMPEDTPHSFTPQAFYNAAIRSFGVPDQQYHVGIYTVLVWNAPLLTHMPPGYTFQLKSR